MDVEILTMPKLGESVTEGTITVWLKSVGDQVEIDDPLIEVSTDKVDSEIPSPFEGTLLEILVPQGETVAVDTPLARIGPAEAAAPAAAAPAAESAPTAAPSPAAQPQPTPAAAPSPATAAARPAPAMAAVGAPAPAPLRPNGGGRSLLSPVVRRLAAEHAIDLGTVGGSGEGGRIMREDIEAAIVAGPPPAATAAPATATPATAPGAAAPVSAPSAQPARAPAAAPETGVTDGRMEVVALSRIRLVTAERMVESLRIAPHVFTSIEVDLERVEQIRQRHKDRFRKEEGAGLTYLVFIARAVCDALRAFPTVNASVDIDTKTMTLHHYVNLGIAVDLDEQGLAVPVIRDADSLNLRGLARAIRSKAEGARTRTLPPDDYAGSTFTITSPGAMGDYTAAPIINQPNVAILAAPVVSRRPVAAGDAVAIHHMTILGFCYDHRAFDGVTASRFMAYVRDALQDRDWEAELG